MTPEQKKYRDRANRAVRGLRAEKSTYGYINDGTGRRYRAGIYFLLAGDVPKSNDFYDWYREEFPEDIGEPASNLYAALAAKRSGRTLEANQRLYETLLSNIFLLPFLSGQPAIDVSEVWHPSNRHQSEYLLEIEEFLNEPSDEERRWIEFQLSTPNFKKALAGYIAAFRELKGEQDISKRITILRNWDKTVLENYPREG